MTHPKPNPTSPLDSAIAEYYQQWPEERRLEDGPFLLEAIRTRELIERYSPKAPATVLDIGGAAGAYSFWLAEAGHSVHLLDAAPRLIAEADRRNATSLHPLVSCQVGDARSLSFADSIADIVLLLGPLYHLTAALDRLQALHEAARVLKPGGWLFASAISRCASTLDGLARPLFRDPQFASMAERDLRDGQHRNVSGRIDYFTTAYFHRPEDLHSEIVTAGLEPIGVFGIEGPGWLLPDVAERLANPDKREDLLRAARMLESESSIQGASAHLMGVARKPV